MALETNLVSNWSLTGNSNDNKDSNNGTDTNIVYVPGKFGQGIYTDGTAGTGIAVTTTSFPTGTTDKTITAWVKMPIPAAVDTATFSYGVDTAGQACILGVQTGGTIFASQWGDSVNSTGLIANNAWTFIAVVVTGSSWQLYINGVADGVKTMTTNTVSTYAKICQLMVIGYGSQWSPIGNTDEVSIWSRALSGAEITTLYNSGKGMFFDGSVFAAPSTSTNNYLKNYRAETGGRLSWQ